MRALFPLAVAGSLVVLAGGGGPARAHVTVEPNAAAAGAYVRTALRVPHGCSGAATTGISVEIPEGIFTAKPMPKPGWRLAIEQRRLPQAVVNPHGREVEAEVARITWEGGSLPDDQYDEFVLLLQVPNEPGGVLVLPVTQRCEGGRTDAWVERPAPGQSPRDLARPAPVVRLNPR